MKRLSKKQTQIKMGLKYPKGSFLNRVKVSISKLSNKLDQFAFWRSPLLWLDIFINGFASVFATTWIYSHSDELPDQVALWYYFFDESKRFVYITEIINLIFLNIGIQIITLILSYKISARFRPLSTFLLICLCIASVSFYIALYKSLSLVVT